tara:strand:- start:351 stop:1481 length:1131 start_codon:yes stop_codon:yes gene_type:complete
MLHILADEMMPHVTELFSPVAQVTTKAGRDITAEDLIGVHILLVRSVTQVNAQLLSYAENLVFVGSATIGVDHIDQQALQDRGIAFSAAPGCNAIAVGQYALCALLTLAQQSNILLQNKTVGIVGAGHTGQALAQCLKALKVKVIFYDPFEPEHPYLGILYVDWQTLCEQSDVLSFHVPLTYTGPYPTHHMVNTKTLAQIKSGVWLLNCCRGEVMDTQALKAWRIQDTQAKLVLDVWEHEPHPDPELLALCDLGTPHIAGHSMEGKLRGTYQLYQKLTALYQWPTMIEFKRFLPETRLKPVKLTRLPDEAELFNLCTKVYNIRHDDHLFRQHMQQDQGFDLMRSQYALRHEFSALTVCSKDQVTLKLLAQIGFTTK